jgi:serine/threonine protein kinase
MSCRYTSITDVATHCCATQAFELVTSKPPFLYKTNDKLGLTEVENMLCQMMNVTQEDFKPPQLRQSPRALEYFNSKGCASVVQEAISTAHHESTGHLIKKPPLIRFSLEEWFARDSVFSADGTQGRLFANFLRRCLRLDPVNRSSARDLLSDPWFEGVE